MPETWTVETVAEKKIGDTPCWQFRLLRPDGRPHIHTIPMAALDRYAAEYDMNPTDTDSLLEILLHEPHMPMTDEADGTPQRYADPGPTLWEAESTRAAREAHLSRVKTCPVRIDVRGSRAVDTIRATHTPDRERVRTMREEVDTMRWVHQHSDLPIRPAEEILHA
ncbi:hypothetical protein [Streptomyces sp. N35]|uniref:hypothetical protein n=1 Tax=Streptomyces sp. N35 TaxID=2795730 RepID=UPI0018F72914|nr:hypothetical protein [Streptomyces sp. N35]